MGIEKMELEVLILAISTTHDGGRELAVGQVPTTSPYEVITLYR